MRVKLPDGTIVSHIPDNITQEGLIRSLKAGGYDVSRFKQEAPSPQVSKSTQQGTGMDWERDMLSGFVRGAGSIGATLLSPVDAAARAMGVQNSYVGRTDRREAMDYALRELTGADTESIPFHIGKIGSEVAGTLGVGGALGAIPKLPSALAAALRTGGFTKDAGYLTRVGAGATVGGAASALVNPEPLDTGVGAVIGGAFPGIAPAARGMGEWGGRMIDQFSLEKSTQRLLEKVTRDKIDPVIAALKGAKPEETVAQAAYDVGRSEVSALENFARKVQPSEYAALDARQKEVMLNKLVQESGAVTEEGRIPIQELYQEAATADPLAQRQVALKAANTAGDFIREKAPVAERFRNLATQSVQDAKGLEEKRVLAQYLKEGTNPHLVNQIGPNERRYTGSLPAELAPTVKPIQKFSSERYADLENVADRRMQIAADRSLSAGDQARFIEAQIGSLESHGLKPLDISNLITVIDKRLSTPGLRASAEVTGVLNRIKNQLITMQEAGGGVMNAIDLDQIRREGINEAIRKELDKVDPQSFNKLAAKLSGELKPLIDASIDAAGGSNLYSEYLKKFAAAMDQVNRLKLAGKMTDLFQNSPNQFVKVARGDNPELVGETMGEFGPMGLSNADPNTAPLYQEIARLLERDTGIAEQAKQAGPVVGEMLSESIGRMGIPGMIDKRVSITNKVIDFLSGKASEETVQEVARLMRNPQETAKVLETIRALQNAPPGSDLPMRLTQRTSSALLSEALRTKPQKKEKRYGP